MPESINENAVDPDDTPGGSAGVGLTRSELEQTVRAYCAATTSLRQRLAAWEERHAEITRISAAQTSEIGVLRETLAARDAQIEGLLVHSAMLDRILSSRSWRLTRVLRWGVRIIRARRERFAMVLGHITRKQLGDRTGIPRV